MQMEMTECGAACLAMILAYHGRWEPLEKLREICGVGRDGANANNIVKAAESFGLRTKGRLMRMSALRKKKPFPCIAYWEFQHFIVITAIKKNKVIINDPAVGERRISLEEFEKKFTGVVLTFEVSEKFTPGGERPDHVAYVKKRLKGMRTAIFFIMITAIVSTLATLICTSLSRVFLDDILSGKQEKWIVPLLLIMGLLTLIIAISSILNAVYFLRMQGKSAMVSSSRFFRHLLHLPVVFYDQRSIGDLQQRQSENETIVSNLLGQVAPLLVNVAMLILYVLIMLRFSLLLTAVGVVTVLLNAIVSYYISRKRIRIARTMLADSGKYYAATVSGIEMIESIKASGAESGFFSAWAGYQASVSDAEARLSKINEYMGMIPAMLTQFANVSVLVLGIRLILAGAMTPGALLAFTGFLTSFMNPVMQIISLGQTIQEMQTQMERIEDVMKYPADAEEDFGDTGNTDQRTDGAKNEIEDKLTGVVDVKHISFGYAPLDPPLIEDFSLHIEPGQWVALVGASGSGKTTIGALIAGLYEPRSGEICFDGVPLRDIPKNILRNSLSVVDQEIVVFDDTIADNIRLWDKSIENYEVILACRDAAIHSDIMERPGAYRSRIRPRGNNFSGGQLQRMEIARVLASDPSIIIMDEATSALDAETEAEIIRRIRDRGITCIVSAHRLSTIRNCDEIIVLDRGSVVERGTHEELMEKNGAYAELIRSE